jgi:hypothetical protein
MSEELKPCPFCGEPVEIKSNYHTDSEGYFNRHEWVECTGCFRDFWSVNDWNTRPIEDALRAEVAQLRNLCDVANSAYSTVDEWLGQASTYQAAKDALWRMGRALRQAGYETDHKNNLDWRGSILKELNDAGFYPSTNDPYHATAPDFVYDPDAPKAIPARVFGNAKGPTIIDILAEVAQLRGALEKAERTLADIEAMSTCSPEHPWRNCKSQTYSDMEHYDCHHTELLDALAAWRASKAEKGER